MKFISIKSILLTVFLSFGLFSNAQQKNENPNIYQSSNYNYHDAFAPVFYTKNGNEYRTSSGQPGPKYWQNRADYKLSANLNADKNEINGTATITYTNNSPDKLSFLWLNVDQNLFKNDSKGNAVIPIDGSRNGDKGQKFEGGHNIKSIKLITETKGAITETDLKYYVNDTRLQIFLPQELATNGAKIKFKIDFSYISPIYGSDRTGVLDTKFGKVFTIAQWFPRMCVYDDVKGWNTLPYLGAGEFYLEYGDYEIAITAPANHFVVCSGELLNPSEVLSKDMLTKWNLAKNSSKTLIIKSEDDVKKNFKSINNNTLTWKYKINNSRDVAWASSTAFIIDGAKINLPSGKSSFAISAYPIESAGNEGWGRATEYTKAAVEHYSEKWFEYPYPTAVNVAGNEGGMEYPGIVFCNWESKSERLWHVTDHEFGHCWFPMIVGSNERLFAWMDEGFNMFINTLSTANFNKGEYFQAPEDIHLTSQILTHPSLEPIMTAPDGMKEDNLGYLAYDKPASGLVMLREQILGKERFDLAFKTYIQRWAFKHPTPDDFFRTIENVSGEDLKWFWRGWFVNNWRLDQGVNSVKYIKNNPRLGAIITISNNEKMAMPVDLEIKLKNNTIKKIHLPVEIWQRNTSWSFKVDTNNYIESITLDPDHVFPDINEQNNIWNSEFGAVIEDVILDTYVGSFSCKQIPIKLVLTEANSKLIANFAGQPEIPLEMIDKNKFALLQAGIEINFQDNKDEFTLIITEGTFIFTRDK